MLNSEKSVTEKGSPVKSINNSLSAKVSEDLIKQKPVAHALGQRKRVSRRTITPRHTQSRVTRQTNRKRNLSESAVENKQKIIRNRDSSTERSDTEESAISGGSHFHTPDTSFDILNYKENYKEPTLHQLEQLSASLREITDEEVDKMLEKNTNSKSIGGSEEAVKEKATGEVNLQQEQTQGMEGVEESQVEGYAAVLEMFKSLKLEIKEEFAKSRREEKQDWEKFKTVCKQEITEEVKATLDFADTQNVQEELEMYKNRTKVLSEVCERFYTEMKDLEKRVENLELSNSRRMLVITGLPIYSYKKADLILEVQQFIQQALGITAVIEDSFTLGYNTPRPIVITLQSVEEKREILKNKNFLRHIKSAAIFINDYIPTTIQERRKKEKEVKEKAELCEAKPTVEYVKGKLTIQGEHYRQKIEVPSPRELIELEKEDLERIQAIKTSKSPEYKSQGSVFQTYIVKVQNFQQIRDAYIKMKIVQPTARHIPCAYWLKGQDTYYSQDYVDDGEPGSGRVLLQVLTDLGSENSAIFAVRKYGGTKIGTERFELYQKSAVAALGGNIQLYQKEKQEEKEKEKMERKKKRKQNYTDQRQPYFPSQNYHNRGSYRGIRGDRHSTGRHTHRNPRLPRHAGGRRGDSGNHSDWVQTFQKEISAPDEQWSHTSDGEFSNV